MAALVSKGTIQRQGNVYFLNREECTMKYRLIALVVFIFLGVSTFAVAQTKAKSYSSQSSFVIDGEKVSMGDMIRMLLKNSYDLESQRYDASMSDSDYQKYQQKYAPYLSVEAGGGHKWYSETLAPAYGEEEDDWDATVAVSKAFDTGTTVTGGVQNTYTEVINRDAIYTNITDATGTSYPGYVYPLITEGGKTNVPALFFKVEQQLLKNGFGINDRKTEAILKNAAITQREVMKLQMSGAAAELIINLWQLSMASESYQNAKIKLNETVKVRNIVRENVRLGLSENFELNYYNALVSGAQITRTNAQHELNDLRRDVKTRLNLGEDVKIGENVVLIKTLPKLDKDELINTALEKRSDYIASQLALKIAQNQVDIAENGALPELVGSAEVQSYGTDEDLGESASGALTFSDSYGYDLRVKMTYPLSNPQQKTERRDAEFGVKQAQLALEKSEREIRDDLASKIEAVKTSYTVYTKARDMRIQFRVYYNKMLANLKRGRFTAETVKNGLDAYIDSKQNELNALVGYNIALVQLDIATNMIFERYDIDIEQYLKEGI